MSRSTQQSHPPADVPESLCRLSLKNPLIFSSVAWALASAGYAMWQVPEAPLSSPELLQEQLQIRIRNIPVPTSSPRYQQFKEYYMREHDIQLQEYKVLAKQHSDAASFNWRAMLQGFGVGSMLLAAGLAVLEYHCGLISYWMEVAEDYWSDCQQRRALQRAKSLEQADHRKVERLLQEIGEEEGPGPGKAVKTRRPKDADTSAMRRPKPEAAAFPPSQPLPTKEAAKAGDAESKNPTLLQPKAAANAAALREQIRSKVIERHCLQQIAATQEPAAPLPTQEKLETSKQVEEVKKNGPKRKGKKDAEVRKKKEVEVSVSTGAKKADMKKSRDPDVEAALQKLAKTAPVSSGRVSGPELLREAQELLSRLEAEDFLRELETEEERAKRAAGKKKAKKARARAKDKKAEPEKTAPVEAFSSPPAPQPLEEVSSESEVEEKITALEDKNSSPSSVEDSTEVQSLDDDRSSSDSERSSSKKGSGASPPCTPPEPSSWSHDSHGHGHGQRLRSWADVQDETTWNDVAEVVLPTRRRNGGVVNLPQPQEVKRTAKPAKAPAPAAPNRGQARAPQDADKRDKAWRGKAPWAKEEAPRQRPCNYAEAAGGHRLPVEVQELMSSMGIAGSRDDLIAFLNANSSKEWRAWKGDLSSYSMKDLSGFASELLKRMEQPEMPRGADGFDGAVAGAQILEWVRGGKTDYKETWTSSTDTPEAQSHLRAEAPEFVPAAESSEVAPTIMTVAVPAELPPGCQIVMVPVQLGQMPQNMVFEEQMSCPGESCDVGCASYGMFCHGSQIFSVDSAQQVIAAAQEAGLTCNGTAGWGYENMPAICSDASCCGGNCVGICVYGIQLTNSCGGNAGGSYSRLCPCGNEAEVTTTTTTAPTVIVAKSKPPGFERSLFLLPAEPMLMLATIPAASKTGKEPAILSGISDAAAEDFLKSFQPETTFMVGAAQSMPGLANTVQLEATSPCSASLVLAKHFWPETSKAVVAKCDNYAAALMAAPLAAQQSVPLILDDGSDLTSIFTELKITDVTYVGSDGWSFGGVTVSTLHTAGDVFNALGKPEYLAVVNPADQSMSPFQSLSALAPMLATLRNGAVLPLEGDISAAAAKDQIQRHVAAHGMPKFLALVGGPQAIPLHCETGTLFFEEKCRDAPYGDLDEDMFMDVALGRVVARDLSSGSLLVSRIANYEYVRDPESEGKYAMGGKLKSSADTWRPALENVGFAAPEIVEYLDILKLKKLHVSAFLHLDHAGAGGMGHSFSYASEVLFSPSIFSSGGCSTAGFDKLSDPKDSVVLTLLHYGAVGFLGGPRNAITGSGLVHSTFWNQIALKKTMGEAFKDGWNNIAVNFQDQPGEEVIAKYVMMNIALFGDPAFQLFIPGTPRETPAEVKLENGLLVASGPERWTKYKADQSLADEWSWHGNLYYFGAPGASSQKWYGHGHDNEYPYLYARFTTTQDVVSLKAVENVTLPLGWTGPERGRGYIGAAGTGVYVDKHPDGSRTLLWRVRLLDYDCETGEVKDTFVKQSYEIITTTTVTTMSPVASCKASCSAAGFCCGTNSGCALPSCHQGCEVGLYEESVWSCIEKCQTMTECFQWNVAWGHSNLCTSCADTCDGEHCEPPGGCEHACHSLGLPAPPTTTTTTPPGPLQICKMKCADDGFCCGSDSGCERPSCQIGCELALVSATKDACLESCKGMTGCFNEVHGPFGSSWANQCTSCSSTCNGNHCEPEKGCEQACSNVFG